MNDLLELVLARDLPALHHALFDQHVDPNMPDDFGSPLAMAASCNSIEVMELLVRAGADVDRCNTDDQAYSPLEVAARDGHLDAVRFLRERGANVDARNSILGTPLIGATVAAELEVVEYLLDHGANIDAVDNGGQTALHYLCANAKGWASAFTMTEWIDGEEVTVPMGQFAKHNDIFSVLIARGANVNLWTNYHYTALHLVAESQTDEWISPLINAGANVNDQTAEGLSALHIACIVDNIDCARTLVEFGADVEIKDSQGRTPLTIANALAAKALIGLLNE